MKSPVERAAEALGAKIDKVASRLERLYRSTDALTSVVVDGSGLRLSQRTLQTLNGSPQPFDPLEFEAAGYRIIADISEDDAYALNRLFRYFPSAQASEQYNQISPEVRAQFEKHFKVDFSEGDS